MNKNRVIYQSQAVYAGFDKSAKGDTGWRVETGTYKPKQLKRIQTANYSFDIARTDVNQFGELAAIDRVVLESPTVSFDTSWYACNWYNEDVIGLKINATGTAIGSLSSCLTDILENNADERNYYVKIVEEGKDANANSGTSTDIHKNAVVGIGNGFLSNYSIEGAVGGFPTASVTVEALNIAFTKGISGNAPWVSAANGKKNAGQSPADANGATHDFELPEAASNGASTYNGPKAKVMKPGDITLTLPAAQGGAELDGIAVQSFNCGFDLAREPLNKLGSRFAFAREVTFPVTATMSVDCLVGDMAEGNLADMIDNNTDQQIVVKIDDQGDYRDHVDEGHMQICMKKAKLDSQSISQGIGDNQTVSLNWSAQVGSSSQTDVGLFLSGSAL